MSEHPGFQLCCLSVATPWAWPPAWLDLLFHFPFALIACSSYTPKMDCNSDAYLYCSLNLGPSGNWGLSYWNTKSWNTCRKYSSWDMGMAPPWQRLMASPESWLSLHQYIPVFSFSGVLRLEDGCSRTGRAQAAVSSACLLQLVILFHSMEGARSDRMK